MRTPWSKKPPAAARDGLFEFRVAVGGVLPDLVGVGGEIDFGVGVAVEDAGLLVVEIEEFLPLALVLEEGFIGADDLSVLVQALADARAQANDALDAIGGQERVAEDLLGLLADAIHAARALDQADDGPRQIVVDDDGAVLQVLAFAQDIGGDQHAQLVRRRCTWPRLLLLTGLKRQA